MLLSSPLRPATESPLRSPFAAGVGNGAPPEYDGNNLTLDTDVLSLDADTLTLE